MALHFEQIPANLIREFDPAKTVFFFPVGPLEDHGPHLPMGADLYEADALCLIAAEKLERELAGWSAVIMPRAPLGIQCNTQSVAITVRAHVLRDWLVDACLSLNRAGFRNFVCFTGHAGPRQLTAIEEAAKLLRRHGRASGLWGLLSKKPRPLLVSANSALFSFKEAMGSPFVPDPAEHGGKRDTSVALRAVSTLVTQNFASLPEQPRTGTHTQRLIRRFRGQVEGYWGDPARATREVGTETLSDTVDQVFPKIRAVLEGSNPEHLFRSWFSVLPPNRSFFKAWMLFWILFILLMMWVYVSFQAMMG